MGVVVVAPASQMWPASQVVHDTRLGSMPAEPSGQSKHTATHYFEPGFFMRDRFFGLFILFCFLG